MISLFEAELNCVKAMGKVVDDTRNRRFKKGGSMKDKTIGVKYDYDKLTWRLVPWRALETIVEVLNIGAKKYSPDNWKKVKPTTRYLDAIMRHLVAYLQGEKYDKETGKLHLAHAGCNLLFLIYFEIRQDKKNGERKNN